MLNRGAFAPCSKFYDGTKYVDATHDQMYKCCKKRCDGYKEACKKYNTDCDNMVDVCNRLCQTVRYQVGSKYFDDCMENLDCLKNDLLYYDCLKENKDKLIGCCMDNCDFKDCRNYCNTSYDINLERSKPYKITKDDQGDVILVFLAVILIAVLLTKK